MSKKLIKELKKLEDQFASSKSKNKLYARIIKDLKNQILEKEKYIKELTLQLEKYEQENIALTATVGDQSETISEQESIIRFNREQIDGLESKVSQTIRSSRMEQAESYFNRGKDAEILAKKNQTCA